MLRYIRNVYDDTIRDRLPRKYRVLSGVAVYDCPVLDFTSTKTYYKEGLLDAINEYVGKEDTVELIGFGRGVTTVYALSAGASKVTAYEAAREMIEIGKHTVHVNRTGNGEIDVKHAIVGEGVNIYGDGSGAKRFPPADLSTSDVLILDCEGAERSILAELGEWPDTILCETHPERGVPTEEVLTEIPDVYRVDTREYEPNNETPDGKRVVVATREN